ncbi:SIR2 family protein [uncultured Methanoregula sp.]|uniref:SIR2 family protein n=1 Tax=uncultured Methanoregula sp. TaxID=1005933 RepID=UPI002AAC2BD3|nr:SIR2 family protein [uncultured Methanoregula sp.]
MPSPDEVIPAAFALHNSPRRYALLVGSGISRDTGILTAGEITDDLICQIAALHQKKIIDQKPVDWYREQFGTSPTFTGLFSHLAKSKNDQIAILRQYFEPVGSDGKPLKIEPTPAHMSIGQLVRDGIISVIITPNFDNLLETAIEKETGKSPVVITPESKSERMDVAGDHCRIVKINGSYPDTALKLTPDDLACYEKDLAGYLYHLFSEYGLVLCGWSGVHDTGLTDLLTIDMTRRFAIFWCSRDAPDKIPEPIRLKLQPAFIGIRSANEFFGDLKSQIEILRRHERISSLTVEGAIKKIKDALRDPRPELILSDLLHEETDRVLAQVNRSDFVLEGPIDGKLIFKSRMEELERLSSPLAAMVATISYYDDGNYADLITETIDRLINLQFLEEKVLYRDQPVSGIDNRSLEEALSTIRLYPALLVVYASGVSAVKKGNFNSLSAILEMPRAKRFNGADISWKFFSPSEFVNVWNVLCCKSDWTIDYCQKRFGKATYFYDYPYQIIHGIIRTIIPDNLYYGTSFDTFEYLKGLSYLNQTKATPSKNRPLSSRIITQHRGPYFDDSQWVGLTESEGISVKVPESVRYYLSEVAPKIKNSKFFGGDLQTFELCNRKYCEFFCIEPINTGIDLSNLGRVL